MIYLANLNNLPKLVVLNKDIQIPRYFSVGNHQINSSPNCHIFEKPSNIIVTEYSCFTLDYRAFTLFLSAVLRFPVDGNLP